MLKLDLVKHAVVNLHFEIILEILANLQLEFGLDFLLLEKRVHGGHLIPELVLDLLHFPKNFPNLGNGIPEEHTCK